ncbi:MAG TPA: tetratricopeptide repeat protein [Desulfobacteraceae bacterium]|mgnify:CR=1 FL=1|nr:tetratricopeptide repeat protein [Desulfobacteraceae bacterium]
MKTTYILIPAIVFLILLTSNPVSSAEMESGRIAISADEQYNYALHLIQGEKYADATIELQRLLHFFPDHQLSDSARLLLGFCLSEENRMEEAREAFAEAAVAAEENSTGVLATLLTGETYFRQGLLADAIPWFQYARETAESIELQDAAEYRLGWTMLRAGRWTEASRAFGSVSPRSLLHGDALNLAEKSLAGLDLPTKSPGTAGVLAALVPGLGHAYVTRYRDAVVAFILNGLFIWAAVEAFDGGHNALGVILGILELGWYTGNIYSAVNVAGKYNTRMQDEFRSGFEDTFDAMKLPPFKRSIGFSFSFRF